MWTTRNEKKTKEKKKNKVKKKKKKKRNRTAGTERRLKRRPLPTRPTKGGDGGRRPTSVKKVDSFA